MVKANKHSVDQYKKTAHFLPKMNVKFGAGIDFSTKCRYTELIYGMVSLRQNPMEDRLFFTSEKQTIFHGVRGIAGTMPVYAKF